MSAPTTEAPTETELREQISVSLQGVDAKTLGDVQTLLLTKLANDKNDDRLLVLAHIPHELAGREIVFAGRAPDAEGELMSFEVTPVSAAGASILVNLGTMPPNPIAIGLSDAPAIGVALYSVTAAGSSVATAPDSTRAILDAAIDAAIDFGTHDPGWRSKATTEIDGTELANDHETAMRKGIATIRQRIYEDGYSTAKVAKDLGVGGEAIRQKLKQKQLLGIKLNGDYRYPAWQFDFNTADGMLAGIREVLSVSNLSGLELAAWFEAPQPELGGMTPVKALQSKQQEAVVALAAATGAV